MIPFPRAARPAVLALAVCLASASGAGAAPRSAPLPSLAEILARYASALDGPGLSRPLRFEVSGVLHGSGLSGTFHTWRDGDRERDDQELGPRSERMVRIGESIAVLDSDGNVRVLRGTLLRRARTEEAIESGAFLRSPGDCTLRGTQHIAGREAYVLDVNVPGGELETLSIDTQTNLPVRIEYDFYDGRETIDVSDWRTVGGHRFPFRTVSSDGDRAFDTIAEIGAVAIDPPIDAALFAPLRGRTLEARAVQTLKLVERDGHLFVPVQIGENIYSFLIDSGAQNIVLDSAIARAHSLAEEGTLEAAGVARTGGLRVARLPELGIGAAVLRDLVVSTLDFSRSTGGAMRIDGILGYPFFAASIVRLDAANRTLTFGPPGTLEPHGTRIDLELDRRLPEARLRLNGAVDGLFVVDTGNAGELLLYRPFVDAHPGLVPVTTTARRAWGIGGSTTSYASVLDTLDLEDISLFNTPADVMLSTHGAFADRIDAGNVGLGILRKFVATFDFGASALYLERGPGFDDGHNRTVAR